MAAKTDFTLYSNNRIQVGKLRQCMEENSDIRKHAYGRSDGKGAQSKVSNTSLSLLGISYLSFIGHMVWTPPCLSY